MKALFAAAAVAYAVTILSAIAAQAPAEPGPSGCEIWVPRSVLKADVGSWAELWARYDRDLRVASDRLHRICPADATYRAAFSHRRGVD